MGHPDESAFGIVICCNHMIRLCLPSAWAANGLKRMPTTSCVPSATPHTIQARLKPSSAAAFASAEMYCPISDGSFRFNLNSTAAPSLAAVAQSFEQLEERLVIHDQLPFGIRPAQTIPANSFPR